MDTVVNAAEKGIVWLCKVLLWVTTIVIFFILCANTVLRYATGSSLQWANEVPELLFPWLVMAGVVLAAVYGAHITTSFLLDAVSTSVKRWVLIAGQLATVGLTGTLSFATWKMLDIVHDEKSPILQIPGSVTYGCVMLGLFLLAVVALIGAWRVATASDAQFSTSDAHF